MRRKCKTKVSPNTCIVPLGLLKGKGSTPKGIVWLACRKGSRREKSFGVTYLRREAQSLHPFYFGRLDYKLQGAFLFP